MAMASRARISSFRTFILRRTLALDSIPTHLHTIFVIPELDVRYVGRSLGGISSIPLGFLVESHQSMWPSSSITKISTSLFLGKQSGNMKMILP